MTSRLVGFALGLALLGYGVAPQADSRTNDGSADRLNGVAHLLFQGIAESPQFTAADKARIAALLPIDVKDGVLVDTTCKRESNVRVAVRDMNGDGRPEVVVKEGNSCVYGVVGSAVHFIAASHDGSWKEILRGDGESFKQLDRGPHAWPTIFPAVRGFCYPAYDFSDARQAYVLTRHIPDPTQPNACNDR